MKKLKNLIEIAGGTGKYQYCALVLAFLVWSATGFQSISIPFLEYVPSVIINGTEQPFSYDYCVNNKINYPRGENISYSWVHDLDIECEQFKVGLLGSAMTLGYICR